jgi:hypothetical protein
MYIFNKFIVDVLLQKELIHLFEFWLLWIQDITTRKFQFSVCVRVYARACVFFIRLAAMKSIPHTNYTGHPDESGNFACIFII